MITEFSTQVKYRADINGLRAIAVLAVMASHAGIKSIAGGFFGVDIFFVISGYLITGIIFAEIDQGQFSSLQFYARRIRRIIPALVLVLSATSLVSLFYLLPSEMKGFSTSLLSAAFGLSNFYFYSKAGYFDSDAAFEPLLHTWSLAVEEQFYLFFPAVLLLVHRYYGHRLKATIVAVFAISLVLSILTDLHSPNARFYLPWNRAWELMAGALLSLGIAPEIRHPFGRTTAGVLGLAMILASFFLFSPGSTHLGTRTILPCFGAGLVIAAGRHDNNLAGTILSWRPIVFTGLISYSLYLWHWPIIVFHHLGMGAFVGLPENADKTMLIAVPFIPASLSYWFIEQPFRSRKITPRTTLLLGFASLACIGLIGAGFLATNGLPMRFSSKAVQIADYLDYESSDYTRIGRCFITTKDKFADFDPAECLHMDSEKPNYLLYGDSHAAHLWYGLSSTFPGINIMQATTSGCTPFAENVYRASGNCAALTGFMFGNYLHAYKPDAILLEAAWSEHDLDDLPQALDDMKQFSDRIVLFGPMVRYDMPLPRLLALSIEKNNPDYVSQHRQDSYRALDKAMTVIARQKGVTYISFFDMLCRAGPCTTILPEDVPLLYDYGHLTKQASLYVAQQIKTEGDLP